MAIKQMGVAPSGTTDAATKAYVDSAVTDIMPIAFHLPGSVTTGVKTPAFICPWSGTLSIMRGRTSAGSVGATYRPVKNGSASGFTTSAATLTTVVSTSQSVAVAAGDYIQLEVVAAGTGTTDLSVTMGVTVP
jgi:hypothetical protein